LYEEEVIILGTNSWWRLLGGHMRTKTILPYILSIEMHYI